MRDITGLSNEELLNGISLEAYIGGSSGLGVGKYYDEARAELLRRLTLNKELVDALKTIAAWSHIPELPASSFEAVKLFAKEALAKVSQ